MERYFSNAWMPIKEKWAPIVSTTLLIKNYADQRKELTI